MTANRVSQQEIDQLVAGELSKPQLRQLISRLDSSPDGWRQCTLAFLEEQSWRRSFQALIKNSVVEPRRIEMPGSRGRPIVKTDAPSPHTDARGYDQPRWTGRVAAVLLALFVGFGVGFGVYSPNSNQHAIEMSRGPTSNEGTHPRRNGRLTVKTRPTSQPRCASWVTRD